MRMRLLKFVLLFLFLALPTISFGQLITIQISGYVTNVEDTYGNLENKIHVNDSFTGSYTYDAATIDSEPDTAWGVYNCNNSPIGISLTIGGLEFRTNPNNVDFTTYVGNVSQGWRDEYRIVSRNNLPLSNGTPVDYITWQIDDSRGIILTNDAIPLVAPDLSKWDSQYFAIDSGRDFCIHLVTSSTALIPEPTTLYLIGLGLVVIRRHRNILTK